MSLFPIFKVNKLVDKNTSEAIYVFYGDQFSNDIGEVDELFENNPNDKLFTTIFDKEEIAQIKKNNIDVIFIKNKIVE